MDDLYRLRSAARLYLFNSRTTWLFPRYFNSLSKYVLGINIDQNVVAITTGYMNQCLAQPENNEISTRKCYFIYK